MSKPVFPRVVFASCLVLAVLFLAEGPWPLAVLYVALAVMLAPLCLPAAVLHRVLDELGRRWCRARLALFATVAFALWVTFLGAYRVRGYWWKRRVRVKSGETVWEEGIEFDWPGWLCP